MLKKENLKYGSILVEQYGYSMTLYNFYKVVRISGSKVDLLPLKHKVTKNCGWLQFEIKPINATAWMQKNVISKKISKYGLKGTCDNYMSIYNDKCEYIEDHAD